MNQGLLNYFLYLLVFCIFLFLQSLFVNGIYYAFQGGCIDEINKGKVCKGSIFYMIRPSFFEKHRGKWWSFPIWGCVRCMSSFWGAITFWPMVIYLFGFHWSEIGAFLFDVPILCSINYYIYKKL